MKRFMVFGLVLAAMMLMTVTVSGCGSKVTKENFDKVETGMTLAEVEGILGKGEEVIKEKGVLGDLVVSGKVYKWVDEKKIITITFVDDKLTTKLSVGL